MRTCCGEQVQVWRIGACSKEAPKSTAGEKLPMNRLCCMSRNQGPHTSGQPHLTAVALWSTSSTADTLFLAIGDTAGGVKVLELRLTRGVLHDGTSHMHSSFWCLVP